jgi:TolB-like protein
VPDIFLSYNREDQARAKLFADAFQAQGFDVWWDVGLTPGEAYDEVTEAALRTAKAVVVLWSKKSVASRWVRAEATLADRNKTLVPCMIEPCERPIMFELTQTAELSHWQGDATDKAWLAFLAGVRRFVAKEAAPAVAAPVTPLAAPTVEETLKPGQSGSAPSLAVLPFTNRSGLPEDEVFAEGMVEDVISALSQGANVRVLGSTVTANLSRTAIPDLEALGRQLGVRYLLEGNVRRVGASLRVTTQLLKAETAAIMWTGKFDRPLTELAELQEELVKDIAANLDAQVYRQEMERALKKPSDITAWEAMARSSAAYRRFDAEALTKGIEEAQRAIVIAPDYAQAHASLASSFGAAYLSAGTDNPAEVERIRSIADRALALASDDASVLSHVGAALCYIGDPEAGIRYTERAIRKAPGIGAQQHCYGLACLGLNRLEDALVHLNLAERLLPGSHILWAVKSLQSFALAEQGFWTEAEAARDESLSLNPTFAMALVAKAVLCMQTGREPEALKYVEAGRRLGWQQAQAEQFWRLTVPNSPRLVESIAQIRALYRAVEDMRS